MGPLRPQFSRDFKTYRVSRIDQVTVEPDPAVRPTGFDLASYWEESSNGFREQLPQVNATYLVDPRILYWIRYMGWRVVEQVDEGERVRVRLRFDSEEEIVQLALAHGGDIELIEPTTLRRVVCETVKRTVQTYSRY